MGEPAAVFTVNGTKLQSGAPVPRLCEGLSVEQCLERTSPGLETSPRKHTDQQRYQAYRRRT